MLSVSTVLAAASLVTTTYAWFKINKFATVEEINFNVVSGLGFEVSIDGKNYYSDLKSDQLKKAIVASYDSATYKILPYNTEGENVADVLYKNINGVWTELSVVEAEKEVASVMKNIRLLPATTQDGVSFTDLYNARYTTLSGRFLEFAVYFKATSDNPEDNYTYDVYMNGYSGKDEIGNQMVSTLFTSKETNVKLNADMTAVWNDNGTKKVVNLKSSESDHIKVYSTNAARISTTSSTKKHFDAKYFETSDTEYDDTKTYYTYDVSTDTYRLFEGDEFEENVVYFEFQDAYDAYVVDSGSSIIYEINDTEHLNTDLGSYATNYSELPDATGNYSDTYYLYNCDCNAMYTYYNNLRSEGRGLTDQELDYDDIPQNIIRTLPTKNSSELIKASSIGEADDSKYYPIVSLESGAEAKLVTFRVWLEGWDADCFDGLSNSIEMRLAFSSKNTSVYKKIGEND
jgi:hypothetical protein